MKEMKDWVKEGLRNYLFGSGSSCSRMGDYYRYPDL